MKKIVTLIIFAYLCAAVAQLDTNAEEKTADVLKTDVSSKPKSKIVPIILLNKREITISTAGANEMKIAVFSVSGRKLAAKNVIGDKAAFTLPKSAKNAVIVQIDADKKFFSQKVAVE